MCVCISDYSPIRNAMSKGVDYCTIQNAKCVIQTARFNMQAAKHGKCHAQDAQVRNGECRNATHTKCKIKNPKIQNPERPIWIYRENWR